MKALPIISSQIDEKLILKIIKQNYAQIAPLFYSFISNWVIRAYQRYNQIDKFLIIVYLIHNNLKFYRKNGLIFNFETFYKDRTVEVEKINISDISKDLNIPKESVRRKIIELEKNKIIQKFGKKIFVDKSTFQVAKATKSITDLCNVLYEFNILLNKENLISKVFDKSQITESLNKNFTFCLYQFNKFIFIYLSRMRDEFKDIETFSVGMVVLTNTFSSKKFVPSKIDIKTSVNEIMGTDPTGVNAMSISEITNIPRPTVVRKLKFLIDNNWLEINEKKLIRLNVKDKSIKKRDEFMEQNLLSFSNFVYRVFNQIKIINS